MELNKVLLIGRLTRDPELSYTPSGSALCKLGIAVNRTWKDRNSGQLQEEATFVDVDAWGSTGEFCSKYFNKGKRIFIEGRLRFHSWEAQDGSKRSKLSVTAERVQFVDPKGVDEGGDYNQGGGYSQGGGQQNYSSQRQQAPAPQNQNQNQEGFPDQGSSGGQFDYDSEEGDQATDDNLPF
ncbi:MAG: single-stranded DNA-binding protein [Candidatus Sumerlaeia bacterium]